MTYYDFFINIFTVSKHDRLLCPEEGQAGADNQLIATDSYFQLVMSTNVVRGSFGEMLRQRNIDTDS